MVATASELDRTSWEPERGSRAATANLVWRDDESAIRSCTPAVEGRRLGEVVLLWRDDGSARWRKRDHGEVEGGPSMAAGGLSPWLSKAGGRRLSACHPSERVQT